MIQVHHLEAPLPPALFAAARLGEGDLAAKAAKALRAGLLRHVADVPGRTLDDGYRASQNIHDAWIDAPSVVRQGRATTARSTMVGDVLVLAGQAFVVAPQGFLPLPA